jgi:hypothetical protein
MNGFIEIVVTVCAIAQPSLCDDKHLQFAWEGSLKQCVMAAQPYIARWIGDHPQWVVKSYHCDYPGRQDKADARGPARPA